MVQFHNDGVNVKYIENGEAEKEITKSKVVFVKIISSFYSSLFLFLFSFFFLFFLIRNVRIS